MNRWQIHRRDPKRPNNPPPVIKTWSARDGSFLPLDRRIITWLKASDVQRRFAGRQEKYFGQFVAQDMDDTEDADKQARERAFNDRMAEANDQFTFYCKKLESRGLLRKIGGMR